MPPATDLVWAAADAGWAHLTDIPVHRDSEVEVEGKL